MSTVNDKELEQFFGALETVDSYVPSRVGDMFKLRAPGYSPKTVFVVLDFYMHKGQPLGEPLSVVCRHLEDEPDADGIWPRVSLFPSGTLQMYASGGDCIEYRASTKGKDAAGPNRYTITMDKATDTSHPSISDGASQEETANPNVPKDLPPHIHPLLACDIDYRPSDYQWPPLPKLPPGPEMKEVPLFEELDDGMDEFFKGLEEINDGQD